MYQADLLRELRRYPQAISTYETITKKFPISDGAVYCGWAATYADAGQYEEALKKYEATISLFPKSQVAHTGIGHLLARLNELSYGLKVDIYIELERYEKWQIRLEVIHGDRTLDFPPA